MEYFYTPPECVTVPTLTISGEEFSHMTHVMRMREGDALRVVDGAGNTYDARITSITARSAACMITAHHARLHESPLGLTLGAGMLKNPSRFDYLVEKSAELGVVRIVPLLTERTIPRHARTDRWQKLCVAAMKQSGRCILPRVEAPVPFPEFVSASRSASLKLIPHEQSTVPLASCVVAPEGQAVVCVGPEGGFSDAEIALAQEAGFQAVSLGPRRLRTETAALAASALILRHEA